MPKHIACYAITPQGLALAQRILTSLKPAQTWRIFVPKHVLFNSEQEQLLDGIALLGHSIQPFDSLSNLVSLTFQEHEAHIFIGAVGIAVRVIAPHLEHKSRDPAVVVCDELGNFAISLLSGHWGGGNALTEQVAKALGANAVITTATDVHNVPAIDMMAQALGCSILDWPKVKLVNAALLRGEKVPCYDPLGAFPKIEPRFAQYFTPMSLSKIEQTMATKAMGTNSLAASSCVAVSLDWRVIFASSQLLRLAFPALCVGIGCKRGVAAKDIVDAVQECLESAQLEPKSLACLASVDKKRDEIGLLEAAKSLHVPLHFYSPHALAEAPSLHFSTMAAQLFGVEKISVSEGAALLAAGGENPVLIVPKTKFSGKITIAIAVNDNFLMEKK